MLVREKKNIRDMKCRWNMDTRGMLTVTLVAGILRWNKSTHLKNLRSSTAGRFVPVSRYISCTHHSLIYPSIFMDVYFPFSFIEEEKIPNKKWDKNCIPLILCENKEKAFLSNSHKFIEIGHKTKKHFFFTTTYSVFLFKFFFYHRFRRMEGVGVNSLPVINIVSAGETRHVFRSNPSA